MSFLVDTDICSAHLRGISQVNNRFLLFLNHNIEDRPVATVGKHRPPAPRPIAFATSTYGINTGGTVYRMDDVPIPLRPAFESPYPGDEVVLKAVEKRIRELQGVGSSANGN